MSLLQCNDLIEGFLTYNDRKALFATCKSLHRQMYNNRRGNKHDLELFGDECLPLTVRSVGKRACHFPDDVMRVLNWEGLYEFLGVVLVFCHEDRRMRMHACCVLYPYSLVTAAYTQVEMRYLSVEMYSDVVEWRFTLDDNGYYQKKHDLHIDSDLAFQMVAKLLNYINFETDRGPILHIDSDYLLNSGVKEACDENGMNLRFTMLLRFYEQCVRHTNHKWTVAIWHGAEDEIGSIGIEDLPAWCVGGDNEHIDAYFIDTDNPSVWRYVNDMPPHKFESTVRQL